MCNISILQTTPFSLDDWRWLPAAGKYWDHWQKYVAPVGVYPYLQDTTFSKQIRLLSGFAAQVCTGYYDKGNQVKNCTVSSTLMAISQTIALAWDSNPTKVVG
jgi:hypothetical protein